MYVGGKYMYYVLLIDRRFKVRQLFKGDNYSREETIRGNTVLNY